MDAWLLVVIGLVVVLALARFAQGRGRTSASSPFGDLSTGSASPGRPSVTFTSTGTPDPQEIAAALRAAIGNATTTTHVEVVDGGKRVIDARDVPGLREAVLKALSDHGVDLEHAASTAAGESAAPSPAPSGPAHDLELLEHLTELHEAGALTDAEFEAAKRRILSQP
jgi:hypothetical protein